MVWYTSAPLFFVCLFVIHLSRPKVYISVIYVKQMMHNVLAGVENRAIPLGTMVRNKNLKKRRVVLGRLSSETTTEPIIRDNTNSILLI